jgi:hypothetical protein
MSIKIQLGKKDVMGGLLVMTSLGFACVSCDEKANSIEPTNEVATESNDLGNQTVNEQEIVITKIDYVFENLSVGMTREEVVTFFGKPSDEDEDLLIYLAWDPNKEENRGRKGDFGVTIYLEEGKVSEWAGMGNVR